MRKMSACSAREYQNGERMDTLMNLFQFQSLNHDKINLIEEDYSINFSIRSNILKFLSKTNFKLFMFNI